MDETYGTYADDDCIDIHDYGDIDHDTGYHTDGDTDTDDADDCKSC